MSLLCYIYCIKVSKKVVDKCQPDTALPCLKFIAFLKDDKKVTDLELTFKGMRKETSLVIASYDLQQIKGMEMRQLKPFYLIFT